MAAVNQNYVIDGNGDRVGVILPIEDYRRLMEELEELEAIRGYDAAKSSTDEAIPFNQAVDEIERNRP